MSLYTSIARPPSKRSTGVGQDFPFENPRSIGIFDVRHPQNNRNERNIRIITGWLGRGSNGMLENSLDCLYLQNENDEHRRFAWSCESFIFWDFQRFAMFVLCWKNPPLQPAAAMGFCSSEVHWLEEELRQTRARCRKNRRERPVDQQVSHGNAMNFMNGRIQIQTGDRIRTQFPRHSNHSSRL